MADHKSEDSAISKLETVVQELKTRRNWSEEEIEAIEALIRAWRGWIALGIFFGAFKQILIFTAIFATAMGLWKAGLLEWLGIGPGK